MLFYDDTSTLCLFCHGKSAHSDGTVVADGSGTANLFEPWMIGSYPHGVSSLITRNATFPAFHDSRVLGFEKQTLAESRTCPTWTPGTRAPAATRGARDRALAYYDGLRQKLWVLPPKQQASQTALPYSPQADADPLVLSRLEGLQSSRLDASAIICLNVNDST
ncbi:hypothetical protein CGRA01v4_08893 [Colletotrichum graminicola]|nr:hypothetical protein CGRA01v4_08893 [Colletotrichum graminicola]